MSEIRIKSINIKNYRSFGNDDQNFVFPWEDYKKPVTIVWYNNAWKTNLMNAILYWIGEKFVSENTFEKTDLHNLDYSNNIEIVSDIYWSQYEVWSNYNSRYESKSITDIYNISTSSNDWDVLSKISKSFFWANKHYNIFYINFHNIKNEISTQKTSWWNLTSFLAKHINKLVENDLAMQWRKENFKTEIKNATKNVLEWLPEDESSDLYKFIEKIKINYSQNLRNNACEVDFSLPDYENIFLQMMFKIGLNWEVENLVPIDHFWDGYISMFVMSVVQSIAESNIDDKCLFLFEEPESFLHENHQEYFYKMVLCKLSEKHQVIYTTHSDKMVDIFDTRWLIRIEFDEVKKQTICKYNIANIEFWWSNPINQTQFNSYIKNIEPNLNKILFSKKTILVEWPNDLMVYKKVIEKKVLENIQDQDDIIDKKRYAETYLNFHNITIIPHHWKATALLLIKLCKYIKLDYFVINDLDFDNIELPTKLWEYSTENNMKLWEEYLGAANSNEKWMITTNWKLINEAWESNIHFNIKKLESVIWYESDSKNPIEIYKIIDNDNFQITEDLFPEELEIFIWLKEWVPEIIINDGIRAEDLLF